MRKILLFIIGILLVTGCDKLKTNDVYKNMQDKFNKSTGYSLSGVLDINNNDEVYHYDVVVDYKKDDYYKVSLTNQANNFLQIILKNDDGVFLLTPSLNKSFKFNSDWPYNNSQVYLLDTVLDDIKNDENHIITKNENYYEIQTKVNYPNNSKLKNQKIIVNENSIIKKIVVYDNKEIGVIEFTISKLKYSPEYSDDYFNLDSIIENNNVSKKEMETSSLENTIYPLLLPAGTKLINEEKVMKTNGERVIMNYDGEKSFLLVEETLDVFQDFTVIPSFGEPIQLMDTIGVMTDNSLSWVSNDIEYYLVSDVMSTEELLDIAQSIVGITSFK